MLQLILSLLGFLFPSQNAHTISQDQNPIVMQSSTDDSAVGDTNGETGDLPPKK